MKERKIKEDIKQAQILQKEENPSTKKIESLNLEKRTSQQDLSDAKANELLNRIFGTDLKKRVNSITQQNFNVKGLQKNIKENVIEIEKNEGEKQKKEDDFEDDYSDEENETFQKILDPKSVLFSFFSKQNERVQEFFEDLENNTNFNFRMILLLYSGVYFVHALILIRIRDFYPNYDTLVALRIVSSFLIACFQLVKKNLYTNSFLKWGLFIVMLFSFWISFYQGYSQLPELYFLQTFQMIEMSLTFTVVIYFP